MHHHQLIGADLVPGQQGLDTLAAQIHEGLGHGGQPVSGQPVIAQPPQFTGEFASVLALYLAAFPAGMIQQAFHKGKAAIMARSGILVAGIAQTNDDTTKIHDSFLTGEERVAGRDHWPAPPHGQLSWRPRRERGWPDGHPEAARYNVFPGPSPRRTSPRSEVW